MHAAIAIVIVLGLAVSSPPIDAWGDARSARCEEPNPGCKVLICHEELMRKVREAHAKGDLVQLLRHTWKDDEHLDDETTPLTQKGIAQADAIRKGLIRAGLVPSRVRASSYLRTRDTAARAIPRRDEQAWTEPTALRKDQCFFDTPKFLLAESRTAANSVYVTHSSCLFSTLYVNGVRNFDPTPEEHYGVMIFLNRNNLQEPIACMWPSDWSLWPK